MSKTKISGKDLLKIGYPEGRAIGMAINTVYQHFKKKKKEEILDTLKLVLENPESYATDAVLGRIVGELLPKKDPSQKQEIALNPVPLPYKSYGLEAIEQGAVSQMEIAARLPVAIGAALMPDAHQGYGLPIGGVLATRNAVIPYGVGVDIGCRMCLTVYPLEPAFLEKNRSKLKDILLENTAFGQQEHNKPNDNPIFERSEFSEIQLLKNLKDKAFRQIGSSGSGNHFVEFGVVETFTSPNADLPPGQYLAILSHSGSRGLGANIAKYYTDLAMRDCPLPKEAKHLAWLDLDTQAGQEYWLAMNLAGDYASACHHDIHKRLGKALGETPLTMIENHHNFAWKEVLPDGTTAIVHRKGATPASEGVLGIIPGSMVHPGYIVRGKGSAASLQSASHGAGRVMSRSKALNSITQHELKKVLSAHGVDLSGGGLDEAPMAYKNIDQVMAFQKDLVEVLGTFLPKIVRMDS